MRPGLPLRVTSCGGGFLPLGRPETASRRSEIGVVLGPGVRRRRRAPADGLRYRAVGFPGRAACADLVVIRLDRHRHGPRVYVLGRRVHEWQLGLGVLAFVLSGDVAGAWRLSLGPGLAVAAGSWLVLKDWRDLVPSKRDTSSWRLGLHRRAAPLRAIRRADGLPGLAAAAAFAVGLVNLLSALTPNIAWRHHLLLQLEPVEAVPLFHTLAVPASVALVACAFSLRARRRRAWQAALGLMLTLGLLALLKGFDFEEALLSWGAAAVLWWGRDAFYVRHERLRPRSPLGVAAGIAIVAVTLAGIAVWITTRAEPTDVLRELGSLLAWTKGSMSFQDEIAWLPAVVGGASLTTIVALSYLLFRPLGLPCVLPVEAEREDALTLVRAHGRDTLAFFKLRLDAQYHFAPDRRAFLGYRVSNGVMLVSGDPIGAEAAIPDLVRDVCAFAEERGLRFAALGAGACLLPIYEKAGLRSLYLGDEAIVETAGFSLDGGAIRKVRQSVSRLRAAGYSAEAHDFATLDHGTLTELERVSALWREGAPERGFTMAMDSLNGTHQTGSIVVVARGVEGRIGGFLHFVPSYGRSAMSLSFMRRDRSTPNGLMEFLVVRSIELLRERGVEEISLNFAAFGRWLRRPEGWFEEVLGRAVSLGNRFFQIESLYRFNAKFAPRWEPRYLVYEGALSLPRTALAALRIEGQLPILGR
jgi:lysyl-tRNA synthetase, class II